MGRLRALLFPSPPRRIPGRRALGIALRTAHLSTFGALLGGHLFDVDPARLRPFLVATVASGVLLIALELASTGEWLLEGRGLAVLAKLGVLALVPLFWEQRLPLLLLVVMIAAVGSHMPARFRHRLVLGAWSRRPGPDPHDPAVVVRSAATITRLPRLPPARGDSRDPRRAGRR